MMLILSTKKFHLSIIFSFLTYANGFFQIYNGAGHFGNFGGQASPSTQFHHIMHPSSSTSSFFSRLGVPGTTAMLNPNGAMSSSPYSPTLPQTSSPFYSPNLQPNFASNSLVVLPMSSLQSLFSSPQAQFNMFQPNYANLLNLPFNSPTIRPQIYQHQNYNPFALSPQGSMQHSSLSSNGASQLSPSLPAAAAQTRQASFLPDNSNLNADQNYGSQIQFTLPGSMNQNINPIPQSVGSIFASPAANLVPSWLGGMFPNSIYHQMKKKKK